MYCYNSTFYRNISTLIKRDFQEKKQKNFLLSHHPPDLAFLPKRSHEQLEDQRKHLNNTFYLFSPLQLLKAFSNISAFDPLSICEIPIFYKIL